MAELGYGEDIYKLALLNDRQRYDLIASLKVLPGHKAKLMSLFNVIDEVKHSKIYCIDLSQKKGSRITEIVHPRRWNLIQP